jgi:hypothetical protein
VRGSSHILDFPKAKIVENAWQKLRRLLRTVVSHRTHLPIVRLEVLVRHVALLDKLKVFLGTDLDTGTAGGTA